MAEEIIRPQSPPPNAPKYYSPGWYYYTPEPYHTTSIPKHPRHLPTPVKYAQHAVHDLAHPYGDGYPVPAPHTDIRETKSAYHLDIELPGLRDKNAVRLKWAGARTLFVDASIQRQPLPEETQEPASKSPSSSPELATGEPRGKTIKRKEIVTNEGQFLKRERKVGEFARAFNFPVDVEQDETIAKLAYGILTVMVPKKEKDHEGDDKPVDIEHAGH